MFKWLLENSLTNRLLVLIAAAVLMAYGAFTLSRKIGRASCRERV